MNLQMTQSRLGKNESANVLNNDLQSISAWAYNWKTFFNADSSKPAQECYSYEKKNSSSSNH